MSNTDNKVIETYYDYEKMPMALDHTLTTEARCPHGGRVVQVTL